MVHLVGIGEHGTQARARPRQPRFHGAEIDVERGRDLGVVETVQLAEQERRAEGVGQLADRRRDAASDDAVRIAAARGDAIGDSARLMRDAFRSWGHTADVYALELDKDLEGDGRAFSKWRPGGPSDVVMLHFAVPSPLTPAFREHRGRRVLLHHNITPPEYFAGWDDELVRICRVGREQLETLPGHCDLGLADSFRLFEQPERSYTWWDYRLNSFKRKLGLRIDHILLSAPLAQACRSCTIDIEMRAGERPSDHAPVVAELAL